MFLLFVRAVKTKHTIMASNKRTLDYSDASAIFFLDMMDGESPLSDEEDSGIEVEEQVSLKLVG